MQGKGYGPKSAVGNSRLPTSGAPPLSHLPGLADAAAVQTAAAQSPLRGSLCDAPRSALQNAARLGPSVRQATPCVPLLMTDPGDLVARALVILESRAAERLVNCPSCGFVNKTAARFCGSCGRALTDPLGVSPVSSSTPATTNSLRLQTEEAPAAEAAPMPSMQRARDGSELRWGEADTPVPPAVISPGTPASVTVAVSPVRPGHAVTVEYRVNRGPVHRAIGLSEPRVHGANWRLFRADLPGQPAGTVEFLPVLCFAGQPISPRLGELAECPRYQVACGAAPVETTDLSAGEPRWDWDTTFLWAGTVAIRKEVIGAMPDGLRINWHVTEGRFVGPRFEGVVLPGGANWLRIRKDGIAIVNVTECLQTPTGARIDCLYDGVLDLGADGYGRAMRGDFGIMPPFVLAPTYATADKELAWLNRAQCIGVGRVDMKTLRADYDVYVVTVGASRRGS